MHIYQDQTNMQRGRERGAALIVSLILLLIMTIIGISAMNSARLEVSMAGMMQREEVALRGAERALTTAERYTENTVGAFDDLVDGHYLAEEEEEFSDTDWSAIVSLEKTDDHPELSELREQDAFVVEYQGVENLGGPENEEVGGDYGTNSTFGDSVNVYRITTRSEADGKAVRIVESIYTKDIN